MYLAESNSLSISDMDNICAFALHHESSMSRCVYRMMGKAFGHRMKLEQSDYLLYRRMDNLSGITVERYDMCERSCCAFMRPDLAELRECLYCKSPRFDQHGKPNQVYQVVPIIPQLRIGRANKEMAEELMYQAYFTHTPGRIKDIFDSTHYRSLLSKQVVIDGETLPHRYFDQPTDIALGHAMDRVALFKSRNHNSTCTPIITMIYNLSPDIRSRCSNVLINAVIPGPKAPKDPDSFMYPITQEAGALACGVDAYNSLDEKHFDMRGYTIRAFGDMMAIYKSMGMTGPGGKHHCQRCKIKGVLAPGKTNYYCPLHGPFEGDIQYDPRNLPLRTNDNFIEAVNQLAQATTKQERQTRVSDRSYIFDFPGCDMVYLTPFDFMHLWFKNNAENQIRIWKGVFKPGIDESGSDYILESHIWEAIGQEMVAANKTIPSAFSRIIPNIHTNFHKWTAEYTSFWVCHLAPILLYQRLPFRYYDHFMKFRRITMLCLKDELDMKDISELQNFCVEYVQEYEEYVHCLFRFINPHPDPISIKQALLPRRSRPTGVLRQHNSCHTLST